MTIKPLRVAHLVSHPIQYFAPLYRELARRAEIDLTVYFFSDVTSKPFIDRGFARRIEWDTPLLDGYEYVFPPSSRTTPIGGPLWKRRNVDLVRALARSRPDAIWAHGYAHATSWLAFATARVLGIPFLLREEQTLLRPRSLWRRAAKKLPLRLLLRRSYGLAIGAANRRYLLRHGMRPENVFPAPYCVDNASFRRQAVELAGRREELRSSFGIEDGAPVILFVGKLEPVKNLALLADSFANVADRAWLLVVGDGTEGPKLERLRGRRVLLHGFLNQLEIAAAYAAADIFVLPSTAETWGLVVNEAMNFELPIVVSDRVGCAEDLVEHGRNGFVFPHADVGALAGILAGLVEDAGLRRSLGRRSIEIVDRYSIEACADGIVEACLAAAGRTPALASAEAPA